METLSSSLNRFQVQGLPAFGGAGGDQGSPFRVALFQNLQVILFYANYQCR
jgi:hypothetical protein